MPRESFIFKIIVGGAGGAGKTTLLHRYLHDVFRADTKLTVGVTLQTKEIVLEGKRASLALWDLGGQDRFRFLQPAFCKAALVGIVFFDMARLDSVEQVKDWVAMFREHASPGIPIFLCGAKLDLVDPGAVERVDQVAKNTAIQLDLAAYVRTSSKTGEGVNELFERIITTLVDRAKNTSGSRPIGRVIVLRRANPPD